MTPLLCHCKKKLDEVRCTEVGQRNRNLGYVMTAYQAKEPSASFH